MSDGADALRQARHILGAMTSVTLGLALVCAVSGPGKLFSPGLAGPAGLIGLVAPAVGYRLYLWSSERLPAGTGRKDRLRAFVRANLHAGAVTFAASLLGLVAFAFSGLLSTLTGVLTHVILVGAIWPSEERLERFLEPPPDAAGGP